MNTCWNCANAILCVCRECIRTNRQTRVDKGCDCPDEEGLYCGTSEEFFNEIFEGSCPGFLGATESRGGAA